MVVGILHNNALGSKISLQNFIVAVEALMFTRVRKFLAIVLLNLFF